MPNRSTRPESRPSLEFNRQERRLKFLVGAVLSLWPSAVVIAGLSVLTILLVLGTRVSGSQSAVGYYTPVAASFGVLYSVAVLVALVLFGRGGSRRTSGALSAVVCVLVVVCSVLLSVFGSSRSSALYIACFVEIGCLSVWLVLAGNMPTAGNALDACVVAALSCLLTLGFLAVNYLVTAHVGMPVALPMVPLAIHFCLCEHSRRSWEQGVGCLSGAENPCFIKPLSRIVSASLGLAFSCTFSLVFRTWLNANVVDASVLPPLCCGCLLAMTLVALTRQRVSVCLAAPLLLCASALTSALVNAGQQPMPTFQLVLFVAGVVCSVFVLASVLPSFCACANSVRPGNSGAINILPAFAACFSVPTLEVVGALLNDVKILGQTGLAALVVYGASCCMLRIVASKVFSGQSPSGEPGPSMVDVVAKEYGLTAREADVLEELFNGRTAPYVARNLSISINTVRSHVKRVYAKLSVHSQQELIDLIETGMSRQENNRDYQQE